MIKPPRTVNGRSKPVNEGVRSEPKRDLQGKCVLHDCGELAEPGDDLCRRHRAIYVTHCECGRKAADTSYEVAGRSGICTTCYRKTPESKANIAAYRAKERAAKQGGVR